MNEYWVVCKWCHRPMKTIARLGNRIKCRFESCGKTFKIYHKFRTREEMIR